MFTPTNVILGLKIAVSLVTLLLTISLIALLVGKPRLHGRINFVFFVLTLTTVVGFEVIIRFVNPALTSQFSPEQQQSLRIHLGFSIPAALLLLVMYWSGITHKRFHLYLGFVFLALWLGTFVTGVFYLPHQFEGQ